MKSVYISPFRWFTLHYAITSNWPSVASCCESCASHLPPHGSNSHKSQNPQAARWGNISNNHGQCLFLLSQLQWHSHFWQTFTHSHCDVGVTVGSDSGACQYLSDRLSDCVSRIPQSQGIA